MIIRGPYINYIMMGQISKYRIIVKRADRVKMALVRKSVIYRPIGGRVACSEFIERMKAARLGKRYQMPNFRGMFVRRKMYI